VWLNRSFLCGRFSPLRNGSPPGFTPLPRQEATTRQTMATSGVAHLPPPLPPSPSPLPLPPLRFLNTSEERVLRHCRPRVSLSTMPRRSRKLPLDLGLDLSTRRRCVNSRVEASGGDGYPSHSSLAREPLCTTCCADAICALTLVLILDG